MKEKDNTISLLNCDVVCRTDPTSHVKSTDIFNAEISIKTALKSSKNQQWLEATTIELKTILKNDTFDMVNRPHKIVLEVGLFYQIKIIRMALF